MPKFFSGRGKPRTDKVDLSRLEKLAAEVPKRAQSAARSKARQRATRADSWAVCEVYLSTGPVQEGILLDLSQSGARVRFRTRARLSQKVRLIVRRHNLDRKAKLVWQDAFDAGLEFVDEPNRSA